MHVIITINIKTECVVFTFNQNQCYHDHHIYFTENNVDDVLIAKMHFMSK